MEKCVHNAPSQTRVPHLYTHTGFPKTHRGVTAWDWQPLILQLWTPGQQEAAKPSLPSTTSRSRGQDDGKSEVWQGGRENDQLFP